MSSGNDGRDSKKKADAADAADATTGTDAPTGTDTPGASHANGTHANGHAHGAPGNGKGLSSASLHGLLSTTAGSAEQEADSLSGEDDADDAADEGTDVVSLDPPPSPLPSPPPAVAELCAACMRFVASRYKVALDGTPDTLSLVDQYVRDGREAVRERPESIDLVAPAVGAYLGEVMRQALWEARGTWTCEGPHETWRLWFGNVFLAFNPIGMAREALLMREEEGWNAHLVLDPGEREEIAARLAAMPEVDEEEYFLPTTRLDVVTAVVETLRARAEQAGNDDVHFEKADYD